MYVRALPADIEGWGVRGWTWGRALKALRRLETFDGEEGTYGHALACTNDS